jgi:hypothetical protein
MLVVICAHQTGGCLRDLSSVAAMLASNIAQACLRFIVIAVYVFLADCYLRHTSATCCMDLQS